MGFLVVGTDRSGTEYIPKILTINHMRLRNNITPILIGKGWKIVKNKNHGI